MHLLGKSVTTRSTDHVRPTVVPRGVLDLGDQRLDCVAVRTCAEVQAYGVEEPAPRAQIRQQSHAAGGPYPASLSHKVTDRMIEWHGRVAQEVLPPEPDRRRAAAGPQRVEPGYGVDLCKIEKWHGDVVGEFVRRSRARTDVVQRPFVDGTAQSGGRRTRSQLDRM